MKSRFKADMFCRFVFWKDRRRLMIDVTAGCGFICIVEIV